MQDSELLEKIFALQNKSDERDARLEEKMSYLSERMDKTEELLEKMSDILNSQKHLSAVVDTLAVQVGSCKSTLSEHDKRLAELESAPAKKAYAVISKIAWIVIPVIVTAFCAGVWQWFKNEVGN